MEGQRDNGRQATASIFANNLHLCWKCFIESDDFVIGQTRSEPRIDVKLGWGPDTAHRAADVAGKAVHDCAAEQVNAKAANDHSRDLRIAFIRGTVFS